MRLQSWILGLFGLVLVEANPDAKRLYDDLLSNYNRLIRPVVNHTQKVTVKLGLRLSQLVDLVSFKSKQGYVLVILIFFLLKTHPKITKNVQKFIKNQEEIG